MTLRFTLVVCLLLTVASTAQAFVCDADPEAPDTRLEGIAVEADVSGRYVAATLTMTVTATETPRGAIRFPLPPGAVLHESAVWVPTVERWSAAATLGRRAGQRAFEDEPREPDRSPLLVQDIGGDLYRARFHGLGADEPLRIRIRYAHLIEQTDAGWALRVAITDPDLGRVPDPGIVRTRVRLSDDWLARDWRGADGGRRPDDVGLDGPELRLDGDVWLDLEPAGSVPLADGLRYDPAPLDDPELPEAVHRRFTPHTHLIWRPDLSDVPVMPRRVVFVVDHSGSMAGRKLAETLRAVRRALEQLGPDDQFGIVAFDHEVDVFRFSMAGHSAIDEAITWLDQPRLGGSTDIFNGLQVGAGIDDGPIDIFLITDGQSNTGPTTAQGILQALGSEERTVRVFAYGIGADLNQGLIGDLAASSGGEAAFALDDAEITGSILGLFDRTRRGGLHDASLAVDDRLARELRAVMPGEELHEGVVDIEPRRMTLEGVYDGGARPFSAEVDLPEIAAGDDDPVSRVAPALVAGTWARRLEREIDLGGEDAASIATIIRLARTYGIVTRYSSHLALTDGASYRERGIELLPRDPAGIALVAVQGDADGEARVGGQGTDDSPYAADPYLDAPATAGDAWGAEAASGCAFAAPTGDPVSPWAVLLAFGALVILRRRLR